MTPRRLYFQECTFRRRRGGGNSSEKRKETLLICSYLGNREGDYSSQSVCLWCMSRVSDLPSAPRPRRRTEAKAAAESESACSLIQVPSLPPLSVCVGARFQWPPPSPNLVFIAAYPPPPSQQPLFEIVFLIRRSRKWRSPSVRFPPTIPKCKYVYLLALADRYV